MTVKAHHYYHRHCRYYSNNVVQQLGDIRRIFTTSSHCWTTVRCQHVSRHSLDGAADADISRLSVWVKTFYFTNPIRQTAVNHSYRMDSFHNLFPTDLQRRSATVFSCGLRQSWQIHSRAHHHITHNYTAGSKDSPQWNSKYRILHRFQTQTRDSCCMFRHKQLLIAYERYLSHSDGSVNKLRIVQLSKTRSQVVSRTADRTASQQTLVISDCC